MTLTQRGIDALQLAADARRQRKLAQIAEVVGLAQAAEEYHLTRSDVQDAFEQVMQEAAVTGRLGAPAVGEFFAVEAAAVLGISPGALFMKLHTILSVKHRHPIMWQRFLAGELWWYEAAEVEDRCTGLTLEAARRVDELVDVARRTLAWSTVVERMPHYIAQADPDEAQRQRERKAAYRHVRVGQFEHGSARLEGLLDVRDAVDFDAAITELAERLPDPDDPHAVLSTDDKRQIRRAAAVGELARSAFGQDPLPAHTLVVHIDATDPALDPDDDGSGSAWVEGWGTLLSEDLPRFLEGSKVTVRPVVDIRRLAPEDQHDPSVPLRFAIQQRYRSEVFPYGTRPSRSCDLDHIEPYSDDGSPGQTRPDNLAPLSRRVHRAKTFGGFELVQPTPGAFRWRTPSGWEFVVDDLGVHRIASPPRRIPDDPPPDPWCEGPPGPPPPDEPPPPEREMLVALQHELFKAS